MKYIGPVTLNSRAEGVGMIAISIAKKLKFSIQPISAPAQVGGVAECYITVDSSTVGLCTSVQSVLAPVSDRVYR